MSYLTYRVNIPGFIVYSIIIIIIVDLEHYKIVWQGWYNNSYTMVVHLYVEITHEIWRTE